MEVPTVAPTSAFNASPVSATIATDAAMAMPPPSVSDAKKLIEEKYPKFHSRFNFAFNGLPDEMLLKDAIDTISGDVAGWLNGMPDNFKTSNHAISRPRFGLTFVLTKCDAVREALGQGYCDMMEAGIERAFEAVKKDIVVPSEPKEPKENKENKENKRKAGAITGSTPTASLDEGSAGVAGSSSDIVSDEEAKETIARMAARIVELEASNKFLTDSLVNVMNDQFGGTVSTLVRQLLA